ncbi:hypothetical protein M9Y10_039085 [Tritrichomonas musculus]|uniref:Phospholipase B-like n=1 Tax=Tritrichomonas musculus TaxID=1915356 RepID=A0ABR2KA79_9EUKA
MFILFALSFSLDFVNYTGYVNDDGTVRAVEGLHNDGDCWAEWSDTLNSTGWYHLNLRGREGVNGRKMGFCAGYLEGKLTHTRIYQSTMLFFDQTNVGRKHAERVKNYGYSRLDEWYTIHLKWLKESIDAYQDSKYWRQIDLIYSLFMGLYTGYNETAPPNEALTLMDMFVMVAMGDSLELLASWEWIPRNSEILQRCTGLIKMSPKKDDIYFAHDSWTSYTCLHSILKKYYFPIPEFSSPQVFLTTEIGLLSSPDDFFINGAGLMVFETTFTLQNRTLYTDYCRPKLVLNWMRTLLAMFTATNVTEWEDQFLNYNSGTYNNDYFVVDTKQLRRREKDRPMKDLIHVIAQLPGPQRWIEDITERLYRDTYIGSFNVPTSKAASDYMEFWRAYGVSSGFCNYTECCRYKIIKRESPRLKDFDTFRHFMRYSDFDRDIYSIYDGYRNPSCSISARGDLSRTPSMHGGINTKATKASAVFTKMHLWAINSPSTEQYPPIDWSKPPLNVYKHDGLIDVWDFPWYEDEFEGFDRCGLITDKHTCAETNFCGWCGSTKKCMPGDSYGPYFGAKCKKGWKVIPSNDRMWLYVLFPIAGAVAIAIIIGIVICIRRKKDNEHNNHPLLSSLKTIN